MTAPTPAETARLRRELLEINRLITSSVDIGVVLAAVTRLAAALLHAEAAAVLLLENGTLKVAAVHPERCASRHVEAPAGPDMIARVHALGRAAGLPECAAAPLVLHGETVGVLAVFRRDPGPTTGEHAELLSALADQAAVALENARNHRRLQAQTEALQRSETRFRLAFDEAPIGVALVGVDGRFLRVNNALCEMVGYSPDELTGLTFQAITHPDDLDADLALVGALARGEIPRYQLGKRYLRKDGAAVDAMLSVSVVRDPGGAPLYFISQIEDVSQRKRVEDELRRSEAQLRGLIEHLPDGVFIHREGRIVYANRALAALLGYDDRTALTGRPLIDICHPDDFAVVQERIRALQRGKSTPPRELRMIRADGSTCHVETTGIQLKLEDQPAIIAIVRDISERKIAERAREEAHRRLRVVIDLAPVGIALFTEGRWDGNVRAQELFGCSNGLSPQIPGALLDASGEPVALDDLPGARALRGEELDGVEMGVRRPDGDIVPVLVSSARIPGSEHTPPGAVVVFEDISALKELERLRIEWSALIAHDLRQPLSSIDLYAQLVAKQLASDPALQQRLQQIRSLARRLRRMVDDLVDFTRLEARQLTLEPGQVDLAVLIEEAVQRIGLDAPDRPIDVHVRGAPVIVEVDADRIAQVLDNLLSNAMKYGDPGTPIRVDLETGEGRATVSVTNRGPGIAPDDMAHLFERFQRARDTRRRGAKGIGLGLHITRGLIEAHGGEIVAESVPGGETTFRFTLPLWQPARGA